MKNSKISDILDNKKTYEIYCAVLLLLTILAWQFSYIVFATIGIILGIATLIFSKDIKYIIPIIFCIIFGFGTGFNINVFPIPIIVLGSILAIICIIFTIKNIRKISFSYHIIFYLILTIMCIVPIFWNNIIPNGNEVLYFIYFSWVLYLIVFLIFKANLKKNSFEYIVIAMTYLGIIIGLEVFLAYINRIVETGQFTLGFNDLIGWGIINEAGILMCFTLPFMFIRLIKAKEKKELISSCININFILICFILTASRGALIFGILEFTILSLIMYKYSKNNRVLIRYSLIGVASLLVLIGIFSKNIIENTFVSGLSDNGRLDLWKMAIDVHSKNVFTMLFGSGMVNKISVGFSQLTESGYDYVYLVYHSTIFQALAAFGIIGLIVVILDILLKYYDIQRLEKSITSLLFTGFIIVDIYGLIDNTYGMFYYMIPLSILITSIEHEDKFNYKREIIFN